MQRVCNRYSGLGCPFVCLSVQLYPFERCVAVHMQCFIIAWLHTGKQCLHQDALSTPNTIQLELGHFRSGNVCLLVRFHAGNMLIDVSSLLGWRSVQA